MPIREENGNAQVSGALLEAGSEQKQRRKMLVALALLLLALTLVLVKNREFLFPSSTTTESEPVEQPAPGTAAKPRSPTPHGRRTASARPKAKPHATATASAPSAQAALAPVITNRAVLPPLEVEVVAGDQHRTIQPGSNSIKVELQNKTPTSAAAATSPAASGDGGSVATSASERVRLSPGTAQVVAHQVEPTYPLLARQMKVQGSVVLQALIGKEGNIQNLQVLSGPAILSSAAREAVKQWRFKPYYQAGHPVETEARITVNFTISTQ
jgi:protein TonB